MKYIVCLSIFFLITLFGIFPAPIRGDDDLSADSPYPDSRAHGESDTNTPLPAYRASKPERIALQVKGWMHFATKRTVVYYQSEADLKRLNKKLKTGRGSSSGFLGLFAGEENGSIKERLGGKIDDIFENAQALLDMYNCNSIIKIMVHADQNEIDRAYSNIISQYNLSSVHTDHIAFYFHKLKTVYVSLEKINEKILAHELAHSIIDHYFIIRPPSKVAEIMAQYVDKHLKRN